MVIVGILTVLCPLSALISWKVLNMEEGIGKIESAAVVGLIVVVLARDSEPTDAQTGFRPTDDRGRDVWS
jgi:hypothetical protein